MSKFGTYFGLWGHVPGDRDVKPFTAINPVRSNHGRTNRSHHFISVTYMEQFADTNYRVQVYFSHKPASPQPMTPSAVGYDNNYYTFLLENGTKDNYTFEDLWNCVETVWPETVNALESYRLSLAITLNVLGMATIMRARVPATRDKIAIILEAKMRAEVKGAEKLGILPDYLKVYSGQFDTVPIGINPDQTLIAMQDEFKEFGDLCFKLGFEVLHNKTDLPFLTSDNPVCSYDPRRILSTRMPYDHSGEIELVFPLTKSMLLRGSSKIQPVNTISRHVDILSKEDIIRYNETIAQFSYRMTIAHDRSSDQIIHAHANLVPTVLTEYREVSPTHVEVHIKPAFGKRPVLSEFIDTPEKALRLQQKMAAEAAMRGDVNPSL